MPTHSPARDKHLEKVLTTPTGATDVSLQFSLGRLYFVTGNLQKSIETLTQLRVASAKCSRCRRRVTSICGACVVDDNGPLGSFNVRVQRRDGAGGVEVRVCAGIYWNEVGTGGGEVAQLCSEWYAADEVAAAEICDLVSGIERAARGSSR